MCPIKLHYACSKVPGTCSHGEHLFLGFRSTVYSFLPVYTSITIQLHRASSGKLASFPTFKTLVVYLSSWDFFQNFKNKGASPPLCTSHPCSAHLSSCHLRSFSAATSHGLLPCANISHLHLNTPGFPGVPGPGVHLSWPRRLGHHAAGTPQMNS